MNWSHYAPTTAPKGEAATPQEHFNDPFAQSFTKPKLPANHFKVGTERYTVLHDPMKGEHHLIHTGDVAGESDEQRAERARYIHSRPLMHPGTHLGTHGSYKEAVQEAVAHHDFLQHDRGH